MLRKFLKIISGGNNSAEHAYLKRCRASNLSIEYLKEIYGNGVHVDTFFINDVGYHNQTALMEYLSSFDINPDVVMFMLKNGAKTNHIASNGHTPLSNFSYGTIKEGHKVKLIKELVSRNANPNSKNSSGYTPLHEFCARGKEEEVEYLLKVGAKDSINHCGKVNPNNWYWGFAPLHKAIHEIRRSRKETSRIPIIRLLISNGADVNLTCNSTLKFTPLNLLKHEIKECEISQKNNRIMIENDHFVVAELQLAKDLLLESGAQ